MANSNRRRREQRQSEPETALLIAGSGATGGLDNSANARRTGGGQCGEIESPRHEARVLESPGSSSSNRLADSTGGRLGIDGSTSGSAGHADERGAVGGLDDSERSGLSREPLAIVGTSDQGNWDSFDVLPCLDGKARRVESGTFPLAHGVQGRVGLLRGYGNAIVPQVAAKFIQAFIEARGEVNA